MANFRSCQDQASPSLALTQPLVFISYSSGLRFRWFVALGNAGFIIHNGAHSSSFLPTLTRIRNEYYKGTSLNNAIAVWGYVYSSSFEYEYGHKYLDMFSCKWYCHTELHRILISIFFLECGASNHSDKVDPSSWSCCRDYKYLYEAFSYIFPLVKAKRGELPHLIWNAGVLHYLRHRGHIKIYYSPQLPPTRPLPSHPSSPFPKSRQPLLSANTVSALFISLQAV